MTEGLSLLAGARWVLIWLGFMLLYTFLDVAVWRRIAPRGEKYLHLAAMVLCMAAFLVLLRAKAGFVPDLSAGITPGALLLALACALALYLLLDRGLDPFFERLFPGSEKGYQETLRTLGAAPVISLIQVCVLAPVMEEVLMRGFLLEGLSVRYGGGTALAVSAVLFALLHFNMVQTLSALVCGVVLGLLYLRTGALLCCVVTHMGYNLISYCTAILPLVTGKGATG